MERRLTEITAELPTKLAREIRALEARESLLAKDVGEKLANFQEQNIRSRDTLKQRNQELYEQVQKLEVQAQEMDYKVKNVLT